MPPPTPGPRPVPQPSPTPTPTTLSSQARGHTNIPINDINSIVGNIIGNVQRGTSTQPSASYYTQRQQVPEATAKTAPRARYQPTDLQSVAEALWSAEQDLQDYQYNNPNVEFDEESGQALR